tara:strand:- start:35 stop:208 length:174 start_codon:yes stop_codon:yes gene_type:complete
MTATKNILSILSSIPPCPPREFEKSLICIYLLIYEKKISPEKNDTEINIERNISKFK